MYESDVITGLKFVVFERVDILNAQQAMQTRVTGMINFHQSGGVESNLVFGEPIRRWPVEFVG